MNYEIIDNEIQIPTSKEVAKYQRNYKRKEVIEEIENSIKNGNKILHMESIDMWLREELKEKGFELASDHRGVLVMWL